MQRRRRSHQQSSSGMFGPNAGMPVILIPCLSTQKTSADSGLARASAKCGGAGLNPRFESSCRLEHCGNHILGLLHAKQSAVESGCFVWNYIVVPINSAWRLSTL